MEQQITTIIQHMARSHHELARIIEAQRHSVVHAAKLIHALPNDNPSSDGFEGVTGLALTLSKSLSTYLVSLADLEEALADHMHSVVKELKAEDEGE